MPQTESSSDNELTLMFFFAADNTLAASMVSQLKAIKDAGFQKNTTVLVRYDPKEKGAPTRIFDVNCDRKRDPAEQATHIGDGKDPFVRNLLADIVRLNRPEPAAAGSPGDGWGRGGGATGSALSAEGALVEFLELCRANRPARRYMLFLIGHGMIVANDAFLPDESPDTAITLKQLGAILGDFAGRVKKDGDSFEVVGMHSCSMSAVELAYELRGTANYMMASQGISFVGTWPYRQLLKKIFNTVEDVADNRMRDEEARLLLKKMHFLCLHNSTDFKFAGFSADLCLCSLDPEKVGRLDAPLRGLTRALKQALAVECGKELVLLAHWKSQSYWQENYTDFYDFCRCLSEKCGGGQSLCRCLDKKCDESGALREALAAACAAVMEQLDPAEAGGAARPGDDAERLRRSFERTVVFSDHYGPTYQYSHGLSIYFPWSRPLDEGGDDGGAADGEGVMRHYKDYAFTTALGEDSWLSFLEMYFEQTRRGRRADEDGRPAAWAPTSSGAAAGGAPAAGGGAAGDSLPAGPTGKPDPALFGGAACVCASIKNFPVDFTDSEGAADAYRDPKERQAS